MMENKLKELYEMTKSDVNGSESTSLPIAVSDTLTTILDAKDDLEKSSTFLVDTLEELFEKYRDPEKRDIETYTFMWYALQHYEIYVNAAVDYINNVMDRLVHTCECLEKVHNQLNEMEGRASGGGEL